MTTIALLVGFICTVGWFLIKRPTFSRGDFKLESVTRSNGGSAMTSVALRAGTNSEELLTLISQGRREPVVFSPNYKLHVDYKHEPTDLMINGDHFMMNGVTYRTPGDLDSILSKNFR